jgi:ABC-type sugar transport system permease subunit
LTALWVIIAVAIWQGAGFAFLVILGAMEEVPVSTYEAAAIDGAGPIRQFFSITLPLVRPVLSMVLLLESIWAFNGFTLVWGMTQGGPGDATTILPVQVYKAAFQYGNFGTAAATSVVGGIILLVVGFVGNWLGSRKAVDE